MLNWTLPALLLMILPFSHCLPPSQFCAQPVQSRGVFCRHQSEGGAEGSLRVIEANRRRMVVDVQLENKGENAYSALLNISYTPNLRFSSLIVKVRYHQPNFCRSRWELIIFSKIVQKKDWIFSDLTSLFCDPGQLWYQSRVFDWGQTEEWEDLQCQCSIHEG